MSEQKSGAVLRRRGFDRDGARRRTALFALSSGGDAFNTAVYLARAGISAGFATASRR